MPLKKSFEEKKTSTDYNTILNYFLQNQYFVVCVPYSTDNDISERARSLEYKLPTGPLVCILNLF